MSEPGGRARSHSRRLGLVLIGSVVGLLLAEGAARLLTSPPRSHDAPLELHGDFGFRGVPDTRLEQVDEFGRFSFTLGPQGFRGRPPARAPGAARRVLFLGDSFLVGQGLREELLLPARAERGLRQHDPGAEAYNLSIIDTGTGQQLLLLDRYGEDLAPDEVVLVVYPANDLANDTPALAGRTAVSPGDGVRPYVFPEEAGLRREYAHPLRGPLRSHSRLFALTERAFSSYAIPGVAPPVSMGARIRAGGLPLEELEVFRRHDPGDPWEEAWRRTFSLLRAVRDRCRDLGARLLVLVVPSEHQVQRGAKVIAWDTALGMLTREVLADRVDWNLPERRLAGFFAEEQMEAVLLLEPLRAAVAGGRRVYSRDGHLSAEGHALAAAPVLAWLAGEAAAEDPEPPRGSPVPVLSPADRAPGLLDFRASRHASYLGDGWLDWRAATAEHAGGWRVADRALLVLPDRAGSFRVAGRVPADSARPVDVRLERVGGVSETFRLESPGPFEVHLNVGEGRPGASADGYAVFLLDPDPAGGPLASPLRVERIGFASSLLPGKARGAGQ